MGAFMQELLAELGRAPLWAQVMMAFFAVAVVVAVVEPPVRRRRHRRRFDALALELGAQPPGARGWPVSFAAVANGRSFTVEHDYRGGTRGTGYRGPRGFLITTTTALAGDRWSLHQADLEKRDGWLAGLRRGASATGDADFDRRFFVVDEGMPVRDGWLDPPTRAAVARFLDGAPVQGPIWLREGRLHHIMSAPWTGLDGAALRAHLGRQADLATALERSAGTQR